MRELLLARHALICQRCGNLRSECSDPARDWHPQESVCWASATTAWGLRRLQNKHKGFKYDELDSRGEPLMSPLDGVSVWVSEYDLEALSVAHEVAGESPEPDDTADHSSAA